nr:D-Ala-D-Ala carboxypeptidase family metallohydrolase [Trichormus azollae]
MTSGYRPPQVNKSVSGVSNSQHIYFHALDMQPLNEDFGKLSEVLKASLFTGLGDAVFMGRNKAFFHGDTRPSGRIIFPYQ